MFRRRQDYRTHRGAFTLVELLVVIAVITILASTTLFALNGVLEGTREKRTRMIIAKLHELVMMQWEEYRTRTVRLQLDPANPLTRPVLSRQRLHAMWELMRMELPDRKSDVVDGRASLLKSDPSLWKAYRRQALAMAGDDWMDDEKGWTLNYQHAECLYLIISNIQFGDSNALEFFTDKEVGDVDEDGMKEILDGWGRPIFLLRWAPGISLGNPQRGIAGQSEMQPADPTLSPDPFDPLKLYPGHYALYPLIFSAGQDHEYDYVGDLGTAAFHYSQTGSSDWRPSNWAYPYNDLPPNYPYIDPDGDGNNIVGFGSPEDDGNDGEVNHGDNVSSHYLGKQ